MAKSALQCSRPTDAMHSLSLLHSLSLYLSANYGFLPSFLPSFRTFFVGLSVGRRAGCIERAAILKRSFSGSIIPRTAEKAPRRVEEEDFAGYKMVLYLVNCVHSRTNCPLKVMQSRRGALAPSKGAHPTAGWPPAALCLRNNYSRCLPAHVSQARGEAATAITTTVAEIAAPVISKKSACLLPGVFSDLEELCFV